MAAERKVVTDPKTDLAQTGPKNEAPPQVSGAEPSPAAGTTAVAETPPATVPSIQETLVPPPPPSKKEKAAKKTKGFVVCTGKSVTSLRGILSEGQSVKDSDFKGVSLKELVKRGVIESA